MFWHYGHTSHNKLWQTSTNSHAFVPINSDTYVIARAIAKHQTANTTLMPSVIVTDGSHLDNINTILESTRDSVYLAVEWMYRIE